MLGFISQTEVRVTLVVCHSHPCRPGPLRIVSLRVGGMGDPKDPQVVLWVQLMKG